MDYAQDMVEFCKAVKLQKVIVIGWSFGGSVAKYFAQLAPELISKVIFVCPAFYDDTLK